MPNTPKESKENAPTVSFPIEELWWDLYLAQRLAEGTTSPAPVLIHHDLNTFTAIENQPQINLQEKIASSTIKHFDEVATNSTTMSDRGLRSSNHRGLPEYNRKTSTNNPQKYRSQATSISKTKPGLTEGYFNFKKLFQKATTPNSLPDNRLQSKPKIVNELSLFQSVQLVFSEYGQQLKDSFGELRSDLQSIKGLPTYARIAAVGTLGYLNLRALTSCSVPPPSESVPPIIQPADAEALPNQTGSVLVGQEVLQNYPQYQTQIETSTQLLTERLGENASGIVFDTMVVEADHTPYLFIIIDNIKNSDGSIGSLVVYLNEAQNTLIPLTPGEYNGHFALLQPSGSPVFEYEVSRQDFLTLSSLERQELKGWFYPPDKNPEDSINNPKSYYLTGMTTSDSTAIATNTPLKDIITPTAPEPISTPNPFGENVEMVAQADGTNVALDPDGAFLGYAQNGLTYKANEAGLVNRDGTFFAYNRETGTVDSITLPADATFTPTEYGWVSSDNKNVPIYLINNGHIQTFNKNGRVVIERAAYQWNSKSARFELVGEAGLSTKGELTYIVRGEVYIKGFDNPYTLIKPEKGIVIEGFADPSVMGWGKTKDNKWVIYDHSVSLAIETITKDEIDRLDIKPGYEKYMGDDHFLARGFFVGYETRSIALDPSKPEGDKGDFIVFRLYVPNNSKGKGVILESLHLSGTGTRLNVGTEFIGTNKPMLTQEGINKLTIGDYLLVLLGDQKEIADLILQDGFDYYVALGWGEDVIKKLYDYLINHPDQADTAKRTYDIGTESVIVVGDSPSVNYFAAP